MTARTKGGKEAVICLTEPQRKRRTYQLASERTVA